jgi:hypothetical protein
MAEGVSYEELGVTCHGAGEFVHVTAGAFEAWLRDYVHDQSHGYGADLSDSSYPLCQGVDPTRLQGPGFVNFGWADDPHEVTVYMLQLRRASRSDLTRACSRRAESARDAARAAPSSSATKEA